MVAYKVLETPLPGVQITTNPNSKYLLVRVYKKELQTTLNRSTGKETVEEAKIWLMENLEELFTSTPKEQGGTRSSIKRVLSQHLEWQRERYQAGFISESSYEGYAKTTRHLIKWFEKNGYKRLSDIQRSSLLNYGLDRINDDGMSPNTANFEIVCIRAWWRWMQDEEILDRPLRVNSVQVAVENRTGGDPFKDGDLKVIYSTIKDWLKEKEKKDNFGGQHVSKYNKELFALFIQLLDESGCRQHEIMNRTWKEISIGTTQTNRKRIICTIAVPHKAKRGVRACVFRGEALVKMKELQRKMCPDAGRDDFIFRNHQTNTLIDASTFSRYWTVIRDKAGLQYKLHTFRSHRITQLILGGVEPQLVGRNLGVSTKQIEKTYLRFLPASHYNNLVQGELPQDKELKMMMI